MSLPRCAKEMTVYYDTDAKLPLEYVKFVNSLKQPGSNSREYLIEQLPNIFKQKKAVLAIADSIAAAKDVFESGKNVLPKTDRYYQKDIRWRRECLIKIGIKRLV